MRDTTCTNCGEQINGNYCSNCGQPAELKRINGRYIIEEISDFFFAHKGMLFTIKRVLISPGNSVRRFLQEDRNRFVKPITFLFITSLVYALAHYFFNIRAEEYLKHSDIEEGSTVALILSWALIEYPGYSGIITGFFLAFILKLFFRKSGYNLFEIFILMCFVTGITTLFMSVAAIIQGITHLKAVEITTYLLVIYFIWAIGQFFDRKKASSYIKVFLSYIAGSLILGILITIIGTVIDAMIKQ